MEHLLIRRLIQPCPCVPCNLQPCLMCCQWIGIWNIFYQSCCLADCHPKSPDEGDWNFWVSASSSRLGFCKNQKAPIPLRCRFGVRVKGIETAKASASMTARASCKNQKAPMKNNNKADLQSWLYCFGFGSPDGIPNRTSKWNAMVFGNNVLMVCESSRRIILWRRRVKYNNDYLLRLL